MSTLRFVLPLLLAGTAITAAACSSSDRTFVKDEPQQNGDFGEAGAPPQPDGGWVCAQQSVEAEVVPLAMLVLIDRSGSMDETKWSAATRAIRAFADRAEVVGMQMGLNFFPPLNGGDQCNYASYATPAVGIGPLPENVLPIQQKLASTTPNGGTPMSAALGGSIEAMRSFLGPVPKYEGAVILVTDGDPSGCGGIADVVSVAEAGATYKNGQTRVRTFAVGMDGATFSNLDKVAAGGGGFPKAFNVGTGAAAQQGLVDALEAIRTGAIGCEYVLPTPDPGLGQLDPESVEVRFTPGGNDPEVVMRKVANADACGATTGGYYYDDPEAPTRVILCPASCEDVRSAPAEAKVELFLGCIRQTN